MTSTGGTTARRMRAPRRPAVSQAHNEIPLHELHSTARRLELLTEHSSDVLCEVREGIITYISPNTVPISGLQPHEFVGRAFSDVIHPDDMAALARFTVPGWTGPIEATFRVLDSLGNWCWREARGVRVRDEDGTHRGLLVLRDITDRRRAEEALQLTEARAKALLTAIPDLMFRMTRDGQYLDFKAERDEDLYVAPELIIGGNIRDLLPADVSARALVLIERAIDDGGVHTLEYSLPKQGVLRDYEARITASDDNEVVVICRDVTDRKHAEDALRESEERYRQIIEEARDVVYEHDLAGNLKEVNAAGLALFGYSAEEVRGLNFAKVIDPAYLPLEIENMQRALRGEQMLGNLEFLTYAKDGSKLWLEITPAPVRRDGQVVGFRGIARDIGERKEAEARIRLQSQVLDAVHQSLLVTDRSGAIKHLNLHSRTMFGYAEDEALGMFALDLVAPLSQEIARAAMRRALQGNDWSGELMVRRKDGAVFPALGQVSPVCDASGAVTGTIIVTVDISELKRAQEETELANEHAAVLRERGRIAEELHDSVAQFFFGIGIASKDLLRRKSPAASTVRRKLAKIQRLALHGGREVRNAVHALSSSEPADGLDISIIRLAETLRTSTGIDVEYVRHASDLRLSAEMQNEMYRAAEETLYNTRKHAEASRVTVALDARRGAAVLTVRDNGTGNAAAVEQAVTRADGFGLRNLRRRFALAGGCMEIFDNSDAGITVLCYLPLEAGS